VPYFGFLKIWLERRTQIKIKKAEMHLKRGNIEFDKKNYERAKYEYKEGIEYLKWVDIRVKTYTGDKYLINTLNLMQNLWGGLSRAYHEIGTELNANESLENANYYMNLELSCNTTYLEKKKGKKMRNRKFLSETLFYAGLESLTFIVGIVLMQIFTQMFIFIALSVTIFALVIYLLFIIHFRRTYAFQYTRQKLRKELDRCSELEKAKFYDDIFLVEDFNFIIFFFSFANIIYFIMIGNFRYGYLMEPLLILLLLLIQGIFFWFTDWYNRKN